MCKQWIPSAPFRFFASNWERDHFILEADPRKNSQLHSFLEIEQFTSQQVFQAIDNAAGRLGHYSVKTKQRAATESFGTEGKDVTLFCHGYLTSCRT